jgi:hypothetical protein
VTVGVEVGENVLVGVQVLVPVGDREAVKVAIGVRVRVGV